MKLMTVPPGKASKKCRQCDNLLGEGQQVLHQRFPNNPCGDRDVFWHAICVSALLDGLPTNGAVRAYEIKRRADVQISQAREAVLASGDLFA